MCRFAQTALLLLLSVIQLNAQLDLKRASWRLERSASLTIQPELPIHSALLLNYGSLAVDIGWIDALIRNGELRRSGQPTTTELIERGLQMSQLDPYFYSIYLWIPAAYMSRKHVVSEESLIRISELMDRGIEFFPDDSDLPFSAAMNFIGHSDVEDRHRRLRELQRSLEYLNIAAARPGAWEDIPGLATAIARRLQNLEDQTGSTEPGFLEGFVATLGPVRAPGLWQILSPESRERIANQHEIAEDNCLGYLSSPLCDALNPYEL